MARLIARISGRTHGWFAHREPRGHVEVVRLRGLELEDRTNPSNYFVGNLSDSGAGSLRQAILDANAHAGADTVSIQISGTVTLASTITIADAVTIGGAGYAFTASGNSKVQVFNLNGAGVVPVTLSNFTISGGSSANGGAIFAGNEQLTLDGMTLAGNVAGSGGGGAIRVGVSTATLTIRNSTISGNTANLGGGIYFLSGGGLLLESSTLSGNVATSPADGKGGGGLYFYGTPAAAGFTVRNATLSGNSAANSGGGVQLNMSGGTALFQNDTITDNTAASASKTLAGTGGGGVARENAAGGLTFVSCIVSGNASSFSKLDITDVAPTLTATFSSIGSSAGYTLSAGSGNNLPVDTQLGLGSLASNGGTVQTHALAAGSPAVDAGSNPAGLVYDGRGRAFRAVSGGADIGAYEYVPVTLVVDSTADTFDGNLSTGQMTLREAAFLSNSSAEPNIVNFSPTAFATSKTIVLAGTELSLTATVTINGPGANLLAVDGNRQSRVFSLSGNSDSVVTISNLTIRGGYATFQSSQQGGGIASLVTTRLNGVVLVDNTATSNGGAIELEGGSLNVRGCSIINNRTDYFSGGGIAAFGTPVTLVETTISGNVSANAAGALYTNFSDILIQDCTITGNSANGYGGGGIFPLNPSINDPVIFNSIVSGNYPTDIKGLSNIVEIYSAIGSVTSCTFNAGSSYSNLPLGTPLSLGALGDYGGLVPTIPLLAGSPAIDAGSENFGYTNTTDARGPGYDRQYGSAPDIGAFESQPITVDVDNTGDGDDGNYSVGQLTLREAINRANSNPGVDTITFSPALFNTPRSITLGGTQLPISDSVTITGPGAGLLTVSGNNASRVFNINGTGIINLAMSGLTITGGNTNTIGDGAAIFVSDDNLTLNGVVLAGNNAGGNDGGAIGVGVTTATLTIRNSTISGNTARLGGGIYFAADGGLLLENSTVSGNLSTATTDGFGGGGLYFWGTVSPGGFTVRNSTISGNSAYSGGGIVFRYFAGTALFQNSTITANVATNPTITQVGSGGGGIALVNGGGTLTLTSTIVAGDSATNGQTDISAATAITANFSAIGVYPGNAFSSSSDNNLAFGSFVNLQPLAANGGPTKTHALGAGSTAINTGGNPANLTTDQRGLARVNDSRIDIGAFEALPTPQTFTVDNTGDADDGNYASGQQTLREALKRANLNVGTDTIAFSPTLFAAPQTIALGGTALAPTDGVSIVGPGAKLLTVDANHLSRVFDLQGNTGQTYFISGVTIAGGGNASSGTGVNVGQNAFTLDGSAVVGNSATTKFGATGGGGIFSTGGAAVTISNSTLSANAAGNGGGLDFGNDDKITILNSTISGNSGGGIAGYFPTAAGFLRIINSTITANAGAGFTSNGSPQVTITSSIVANNSGPTSSPDGSTGPNTVTASNSAFGSTAGIGFATSANNLVGAALNLGPLQYNGGPTKTHALGAGSAAINAGSNTANLPADQRGAARVVGSAADIGAVERQATPAVAGVVVNGGDAQRSRVTTLRVTFSGAVNLAANAFTLTRPSFDPTSPTAATLVSGTPAAGQGRILVAAAVNGSGQTIATLTFATNAGSISAVGEGVEAGSLSDGSWILSIPAAGVTSYDGAAMAADFATPGGTGTYAATGRVYRLLGDGDGDADSDITDLAQFRQTFTAVSGDPTTPAYLSAYDADNDGDVDISDLSQFRQRFTLIV